MDLDLTVRIDSADIDGTAQELLVALMGETTAQIHIGGMSFPVRLVAEVLHS